LCVPKIHSISLRVVLNPHILLVSFVSKMEALGFSETFITTYETNSGFGGLEDACWPLVPKFAGSNPAGAVGFFSTPSFGGEVNPAVPCRRFASCKITLNVTWKSAFRQNSRLLFLAH
jgi:hypothetical protein